MCEQKSDIHSHRLSGGISLMLWEERRTNFPHKNVLCTRGQGSGPSKCPHLFALPERIRAVHPHPNPPIAFSPRIPTGGHENRIKYDSETNPLKKGDHSKVFVRIAPSSFHPLSFSLSGICLFCFIFFGGRNPSSGEARGFRSRSREGIDVGSRSRGGQEAGGSGRSHQSQGQGTGRDILLLLRSSNSLFFALFFELNRLAWDFVLRLFANFWSDVFDLLSVWLLATRSKLRDWRGFSVWFFSSSVWYWCDMTRLIEFLGFWFCVHF